VKRITRSTADILVMYGTNDTRIPPDHSRMYGRVLRERPRGKLSSGGSDGAAPRLPRLTVDECVRYTLTLDPDVALLGLSFPNEQDATFAAARAFTPLTPTELDAVRARARDAVRGKGRCWWNPDPHALDA